MSDSSEPEKPPSVAPKPAAQASPARADDAGPAADPPQSDQPLEPPPDEGSGDVADSDEGDHGSADFDLAAVDPPTRNAKGQWVKGVSGNWEGSRVSKAKAPRNALEEISQELIEEIIRLWTLKVRDLTIEEDDSMVTAGAKTILRDGFQKPGDFRKIVIKHFFETALNSDRFGPVDQRTKDAEFLNMAARLMMDPRIPEEKVAKTLAEFDETPSDSFKRYQADQRKRHKRKKLRRKR